jgi:hypothetical protein
MLSLECGEKHNETKANASFEIVANQAKKKA